MMIKRLLFVIALLPGTLKVWSQSGCTDPNATNYNSSATVNNGTCAYPATNITLTHAKTLSATIEETSGVIYTDGKLWTMNDSGHTPQIFQIDSATGAILQTVTLSNATNVDWEDITADDDYLYIGDFGNNAAGNRTNLRIYRVAKTSIGAGSAVSVTAQIINFSYQDQAVGAAVSKDSTNYDCEAFIVKNNTLHLFSKDWLDGQTRHYTLVNTPGTQVAVPLETLNVNGLITAAAISAHNDIVLLGYSTNLLSNFIYLLNDYSADFFFSGNKRRFNLGSSFTNGQTEGITFVNNTDGYISNEKVPGFVSPMLHSFSLVSYLALPIKMTDFKAAYINPGIALTWQTASEINGDFFSVERSADAQHFKEIGRKNAAGNSTAVLHYEYIDRQPSQGLNYYRLKLVDRDGAFALSDIKTVKVSASAGALKAYIPGVGNNQAIIDNGQPVLSKTTYQLISISGVVLQEGILRSQRQSINLSGAPSGQYIIRLSDGRSVKFLKS